MAILSNHWKSEAIQRFSELAAQISDTDTPYLLWFELLDSFRAAYQAPRNEDLIRRIYAYADWCVAQPQGSTTDNDLATCVTVCFTEHIPTIPEALDDMPRWFTREDVERMKETFTYLIGEGGYSKLLARFDSRRK